MPDDLEVSRTAGPFDAASAPPALLKEHQIAERTWGDLRVLKGSLKFIMATDPPLERRLLKGEHQPIPPGIKHRLVLEEVATFVIDLRVHPDPCR
jgi:tellurite resistance-related uncharacterized protein